MGEHRHGWLAIKLLGGFVLAACAVLAQAADRRVALVIGNSAYPQKPLRNPGNDAADLASSLRRMGFEVMERKNRSADELRRDVADFQDKLGQATVGLFYFAGHGVQAGRGLNYLLPVGVEYKRERDAELYGLEVGSVLRRMEESGASLSMVILDACRDSPLPAEGRSMTSRGLGRMEAPSGSMVAFSTAPGSVADENSAGRNGLYTQHLLAAMETPGLRLEDVFKRVRRGVEKDTNRRQSPEEINKLTSEEPFYFKPDSAAQQQANARAEPLQASPPQVVARIDPLPQVAPLQAQPQPVRRAVINGPLSGTLRKMQDSGSVTMGVRERSSVLSFNQGNGQYTGYHVELCARVLDELKQQLRLPRLEVRYLAVTTANRVPLVQNGSVDIECGSTANNEARQRDVAFAVSTFVEEVRMAVRADSGISSVAQLNGKNVAVTVGTIYAQQLRRHPAASGIAYQEVFGKDHADAFQQLASGRADAFVMESSILASNIAMSANPSAFRITGEVISREPISIMLRQDSQFKQAVDAILQNMIASGEVARIYDKWFVQSLPTGGRVGLPVNDSTRSAWASPNDRPFEQLR